MYLQVKSILLAWGCKNMQIVWCTDLLHWLWTAACKKKNQCQWHSLVSVFMCHFHFSWLMKAVGCWSCWMNFLPTLEVFTVDSVWWSSPDGVLAGQCYKLLKSCRFTSCTTWKFVWFHFFSQVKSNILPMWPPFRWQDIRRLVAS